MTLISSKEIVLQDLDEGRLRWKTDDCQGSSSFTNHHLPNKLNPVSIKGGENSSKTMVNVIDLNKKNIYISDSEIALILKYWCSWKSAVNIHTALKIKVIKRKEITFNKVHQSSELNIPLKNGSDYIFMPNPIHCRKERKASTEKCGLDKSKLIHQDENLRKSLEIHVCYDNITLKQYNQDILCYYWNLWKNHSKGKKVINKIDSFLNIVSEEKNNVIKRYHEENKSDVYREQYVKAHKIRNKIFKRYSLGEAIIAKKHFKMSSSRKGFSNQMLKSMSEKNISVSSMKEEVKASLKRAHSLLENTIEDSSRGNHIRRKNLNLLIGKRSPRPHEMADSDILERMKIREMERIERWQKLKERRKLLDEEKKRKIEEEEKKALRQKEALKNLKLEEQRSKQQLEIEKEKKFEAMKQKRFELNIKAAVHYRRRLLQMGIRVFQEALAMKAELLLDAHNYYQNKLLSEIFLEWRYHCHIQKERQLSLAAYFYHRHLLRFYFKIWMKLQMEFTFNKQAAIDFYEMKVQENVIIQWHQFTCDMIIEENLKLELAESLYSKSLLKKYFFSWKILPSVVQAERARDKIKSILRQKVLEVIPDFSPDIGND